MKKCLGLVLIALTLSANAQVKKDTCLIGIYLKALYDLSPSDFSFGADFYIWNNCKDSISLFKKVEITNAKKIDDYSSFNDKDGNSFVSYENCKAQLRQKWNLKKYPFDKQTLEIAIEAQDNTDLMLLREDQNNFQLANDLKISGWRITDHHIEKSITTYTNDFGYHNNPKKNRSYNQLKFVIELTRESWGLYFKLFSGLYIAFFVSFLAFFVKPEFVDPRFGLSIGGLFASVANKYVVDANIPATTSFSFVDMVHFTSFFFILATLIVSTISLKLYSKGKTDESRRLDSRASIMVLLLYIVLNIILIIAIH